MPDNVIPFTPADAGRILEGSAVRTADELNVMIARTALTRGWKPADIKEVEALLSDWRARAQGPGDFQVSTDLEVTADDALEWLNENAVPDGYTLVLDDGLDLVPTD